MSHLDELSCLRYIDGQLQPDRGEEVRAHLDTCAQCRRFVDALDRETRLLRGALVEAEEELPTRVIPPPAADVSWALLGVMAVAALGLYTFWNGIVMPWWQRLQMMGLGGETLLTVLVFKGFLWEGWSKMGHNIVQGAVTLPVVVVVITLVRRSWRFVRPSASMLFGLVCLLLLTALSAEGAVIETGKKRYVLEKDRVIHNDLIVGAESIRIEGTVDGDLIAGAQTVTVTGRVTGDVLAFCQRVEIEGVVEGNVRSGSQFLDVSGRVGKNVTAGAEAVEIRPEGVVEGSLTLGAKRVALNGRTGRDLMLGAERATLDGPIGGGALMAGRSLTIGPRAELGGEAKFYGTEQPEVSPEAQLAQPLHTEIREPTPVYASSEAYLRAALRWAAAFIFGLVLLLALPEASRKVVETSTRYGMALLAGAVALVVVPVLALVACATLVGIPVGLTALFLYAVACYAGQVFIGSWLGREMLGLPAGRGQALGRLALGLLVLHIAAHIPYMGLLVKIVVAAWGLGALTLAIGERARLRAAAV